MDINYITPWYAELSFESLKDLLKWKINQAIIPFENFVFRGLSKSSYKLIPSALRKDEKTNTYPILNHHPSGYVARMAALNIGIFVESEYIVLFKFFKESNKKGLFIPSNRNISSNYLKRYNNEYFDKISIWYDDDMRELAALAQHYGVPTRMLDWTFNFNVAFILHL